MKAIESTDNNYALDIDKCKSGMHQQVFSCRDFGGQGTEANGIFLYW